MRYFLFRFITFYSKHPIVFLGGCILGLFYYNCLPKTLFNDPYSTVLYSSNQHLLNAQIAKDGQWRFPESKSISTKFETCIIQFEDAHFYYHWGFNPISISKALYKNFTSKKIKRGGSTISQQVIRLSRKNKGRTYWEKLIETILSTRLEFSKSKEEILNIYSSHAPFGGNVVGLEAASWRYFNRKSEDLSWAETATLAVLPNAPGLIYPGRNQLRLKQKRNQLLKKLWLNKYIDQTTYELSCLENLPQKPTSLPQLAPHLLTHLSKKEKGKIYKTTIDFELQKKSNQLIKEYYHNNLKHKFIKNAAILILDVETRAVLAYVGNTPTSYRNQKYVDNIQSERSSGSILKPFLYAAMFNEGSLLPEELVLDIPTQISNFSPLNFDETYAGVIPANLALSQSLNVPAVRLLRRFYYPRFHKLLKRLNFNSFNKPSDYYGLSLILGGGECSLWDVTKNYAALSSILKRYDSTIGEYAENEFCEPILIQGQKNNFGSTKRTSELFDAGSVYSTFQALKQVNRPKNDASWQYFESAQDIAWKTGTSFGFRDAWAVGATSKYVVGVWVGNSDGEGRPGITGVKAAAPLMFNVFKMLPFESWPPSPDEDMEIVNLCAISKKLPNPNCPKIESQIPKNGIKGNTCVFHKKVHLNYSLKSRVNRSCYPSDSIQTKSWFTLPPLAEWYYKSKNPQYVTLPGFSDSCLNFKENSPMQFIYPEKNTSIYLPRNRFGKRSDLVVMIAHNQPEKEIYWYLDREFVGKTQHFHTVKISPLIGDHIILAIDENGNELKRKIQIVE